MTIIIFLCASLLVSCKPEATATKEVPPVRIGIFGYEQAEGAFREYYTSFLDLMNDGTAYELVSLGGFMDGVEDRREGLTKDPMPHIKEQLTRANKPIDMIVTNSEMFRELSREQYLLRLDTLVAKERYSLDGINPKVLSRLRTLGNGELYGLAPAYTASFLFYNKQIFDRSGVPYPQQITSWEELFQTAARVSSPDSKPPVKGLSFGRNNQSIESNFLIKNLSPMLDSSGIFLVNAAVSQVTVNMPKWHQFLTLLRARHKQGAFDYNDPDPAMMTGLGNFLNERTAMTVQDVSYISYMKEVEGRFGLKPDWDMAPLPLNPETNAGQYIELKDIMAINANSPNVNAAWNVVKLLNGSQWAKYKSKTMSRAILSQDEFARTQPLMASRAELLERPDSPPQAYNYEIVKSHPHLKQLWWHLQAGIERIVLGDEDIPEALRKLEDEGNVLLRQASGQ